MTTKVGYNADLYVAKQPGVTFTDEATADVGTAGGAPAARWWYGISNAAKRFWDRGTAVVVERDISGGGWSTVPATEYTVQHCGGRIRFLAQQDVGTSIRVDGKYLAVAQLGQAHEWAGDFGADIMPAPQFGSGWTTKVAGLKEGTASIERWWLDDTMMDEVVAGAAIVCVLYADYAAGSRYEAFAQIAQDSISIAVDGIVEEAIDLDLDGEVFYVAS